MAVLFAWLDVFKLMSVWEMIGCLLLGAVAALLAWPLSGQMLDTLPMGYSFYSRDGRAVDRGGVEGRWRWRC